jgi:hypothetical protein
MTIPGEAASVVAIDGQSFLSLEAVIDNPIIVRTGQEIMRRKISTN